MSRQLTTSSLCGRDGIATEFGPIQDVIFSIINIQASSKTNLVKSQIFAGLQMIATKGDDHQIIGKDHGIPLNRCGTKTITISYDLCTTSAFTFRALLLLLVIDRRPCDRTCFCIITECLASDIGITRDENHRNRDKYIQNMGGHRLIFNLTTQLPQFLEA